MQATTDSLCDSSLGFIAYLPHRYLLNIFSLLHSHLIIKKQSRT
jgi:hypothetical protein